jgi:hypothetical protein
MMKFYIVFLLNLLFITCAIPLSVMNPKIAIHNVKLNANMTTSNAVDFKRDDEIKRRQRNLATSSSTVSSIGSSIEGCKHAGLLANPSYANYFKAMDNIYNRDESLVYNNGIKTGTLGSKTCLSKQKLCGWSKTPVDKKNLPLFVISVGLEGAGHHLWTDLLNMPIFDCVWKNGRHYKRNIGDGVPRTTISELKQGFIDMFKLRKKAACKTIFDSEDSFPTGAIRKSGRMFNRPDIVNLQELDGVLINVKYLLIMRNVTDTAMSALRRNFVTNVDAELRAVEHTLSYLESSLQKVPCDKIFIAHYEHVIEQPMDYLDPLASFLELTSDGGGGVGGDGSNIGYNELKSRLNKQGKLVSRKAHKLTQYHDCKEAGLQDVASCYKAVSNLADKFFKDRAYMWPTFAGNGFDWKG